MEQLFTFFISFSIVYLSMPLFRKLALKFSILDTPNKRKIHKIPTPLLGGLAIYAAVTLGALFMFVNSRIMLGILIGGTIIVITGLIDDIRDLPAPVKLGGHFIAAMTMIYFGASIEFLPNNLWGNITAVSLTLVWIIGITNALNFLDGIDGLAGGSVAISALFFFIIAYKTNQDSIGLLALILSASCLGFLPYNFAKEKKIFLGDTGSTFIGFVLANIALIGNWAEDNIIKITVPILILGVPIFDMTFTTIMRIKERKIRTIVTWLKYEGKDHFHHRLIDLGLRPGGAVVFIYFVTFSLCISAIIISNAQEYFDGILSILQASIIFGVISVLMVVGKRRRSGWGRQEDK